MNERKTRKNERGLKDRKKGAMSKTGTYITKGHDDVVACSWGQKRRSQLWQSLVEGCPKPMTGVWECPFDGITNCGRVWRKGTESEDWSLRVPIQWRKQ